MFVDNSAKMKFSDGTRRSTDIQYLLKGFFHGDGLVFALAVGAAVWSELTVKTPAQA